MKKQKYMNWETYFMSVALLSSFRSKDKKTQTGACIANTQKKIIWVWYNGLPRWLDDNNPLFWEDDDNSLLHSKHSYVIHAEQNAIYNAKQDELENSTMYITLFPCKECAKAICQVWIKKIIYLNTKPHHEEHNLVVKTIFDSAWIEYIKFEDILSWDKIFTEELIKINKEIY